MSSLRDGYEYTEDTPPQLEPIKNQIKKYYDGDVLEYKSAEGYLFAFDEAFCDKRDRSVYLYIGAADIEITIPLFANKNAKNIDKLLSEKDNYAAVKIVDADGDWLANARNYYDLTTQIIRENPKKINTDAIMCTLMGTLGAAEELLMLL